jgi:hypothetical protein
VIANFVLMLILIGPGSSHRLEAQFVRFQTSLIRRY